MQASPEQRLSSEINDVVTQLVLHNAVQKIYMYDTAYFVSERVRKEFLERLIQLNHLSHFESFNVTKLGDIHELIYRSNVSNTLVYLNLRRIIPDSRASKLFARQCCFCKIAELILDVNYGDNLRNSAYFVSKILSTCTKGKEVMFYNFKGCGVEPFALEDRSRKLGSSKIFSPSSLAVTTLENRACMKNLMAKVMKLPRSEPVSFTWSCTSKLDRLLKSSEKQYWYHIKTQ